MKKILLSIIVLFFCNSVQSATVAEVQQKIIKQSKELGVDPAIMLSLAKAESGFRQEARGGNAVGVFQLLPATGKFLGVDVYDLDGNIKGGILYYKSMYNMFGTKEKALAAYNLGARPVKNCNCVPQRSQAFVNKVISNCKYYKVN